MTKMEYANAIAELVNGRVIEVEKANGVQMVGIVPLDGGNIKPTIYVDSMYNDRKTVDEAAQIVKEVFMENANTKFNPDMIMDFDYAQSMLRARLYNKKTNAEVFESAEKYGFDDLIIVPYLEVEVDGKPAGIKVTKQLLEKWEASTNAVIRIAEKNSKQSVKWMLKTMAEMLGMIFDMPDDCPKMYVCTNEDKSFGAYGAIAYKEGIEKLFPNGYAVIPSSVHEVIIVEKDDDMVNAMPGMIDEVNAAYVADTETLGTHPYLF